MGRWLWKSFFCFFILTCITGAQKILLERSRASILDEKTCETAAFREQHLPTELYRQLRNQDESSGNTDWIENLTTTMLNGKFYPGRCSSDREPYLRYNTKNIQICAVFTRRSGRMSDIFRSQQMTSHLRTAGWKREALGESVFMKAVIFLEVAGQQIFIRSSV